MVKGRLWTSDLYHTINSRLLGQSLEGVLPESLVFNELMLYQINMGYSGQKRSPHASVAYTPGEHKFYHPWSWESSGKTFGFNKIKEVMTLEQYMTWPVAMVDALLDGLVEGESTRYKLDNPEKPTTDKDPIQKAQDEIIKALGLKDTLKDVKL